MQRALLDDPADEIIMHIDVLHLHVVLVVPCEGDGCLVIRKEGGGRLDGGEHLE